MLGAIAGDIIGSPYELQPIKTTRFPLFQVRSRFTDDTVLTVAVADALYSGRDYAETFQAYVRAFPRAGYGGNFIKWAQLAAPQPYNSWGNGSAMRVSPVAYLFDSLGDVLAEASRSAAVTHNHIEGIKGAQATAVAVWMARKGEPKDRIRDFVQGTYRYDLNHSIEEIRPHYCFDVSCQETVPAAIIAFLDSSDFEDAIRKAVSLGGDSDTLAAITGSIAEAFYGGVPDEILSGVMERLDERLIEVILRFKKLVG